MSNSTSTAALILGFTGSFAGAVAREMHSRNIKLRALVRDVNKAKRTVSKIIASSANNNDSEVELIQGDALNADDVVNAAKGCNLIVHGINYPYDKWIPNMENVTRNVVNAASANKSTVIFPGNVYLLKPTYNTPLTEDHPHEPLPKKGQVRLRLETMLKELVASNEDCKVLVMRANDYFGPSVRNGYVDGIFANVLKGKSVLAFGNLDAIHEFAYVPDLARATVDLVLNPEREAKLFDNGNQRFQVVHFTGYSSFTSRQFMEAAHREAQKIIASASASTSTSGVIKATDKVSIMRAPWWLLRGVGWFDGIVSELCEMRYLFDNTLILGDSKLQSLLAPSGFTATPVEVALQETLKSYLQDILQEQQQQQQQQQQ